ncbi:hypothetical protein DGMP_04320 [Desulfomarina profundi]|uniref:Uncharacterized protein n=1 Tax=Desulfomarina profundi TaxID=2772557 RepID=A0A8D5FQ42_9BACT|nr:hypothetical protein DGMP_04320 [Desulfomarina profundi]
MVEYASLSEKLLPKNRWIKWSLMIPWDEFASGYYKNMSSTKSRPGNGTRFVIGAVSTKLKLRKVVST